MAPQLPLHKRGDNVIPNVIDLNDVKRPLYPGARRSKLFITPTLMNRYCTIHSCSNKLVYKLLFLLHKFILLVDNYLPIMYHAKSLTQKMAMECNLIRACKRGCILYRGIYADLQECLKCGSPIYKQVSRIRVPMKGLCHFPIIHSHWYIFIIRWPYPNFWYGIMKTKSRWPCLTCGGFQSMDACR
jgi:hypothetical protein